MMTMTIMIMMMMMIIAFYKNVKATIKCIILTLGRKKKE